MRYLAIVIWLLILPLSCYSQFQELYDKGVDYYAANSCTEASKYFEFYVDSLTLLDAPLHDTIRQQWESAYLHIGMCSHDKGEFDKAITQYRQAYTFSSQHSDTSHAAFYSIINIARCYAHKMQIDSAIHYIQLLEPLLIGLNNEYLAEHQMTLGWIFQRSRMTQEAIKAYRTAAKYFLKNSMLEKAAWAYFDVVLCHDDAQEYQQAIDALTRCDSINNAIHSLDYLWPITACRAILLSQLDRHQEALGFYEKSFVLAEELGTEFCCGNKVFYALSKLNLGQHEGLREIIDEARVKVEEVEFPREKSVIYKAIYQSYEALGDDSLALIYHKLYTKELESVSHLDYQVTLARMEAEKEMLQLKQELVSLDSKLEKENSRNISYRWIGVLAALVILLLTYLLYRWRMYKRYYEYDQQGWRRLKEDLSDKGMSKSEETILQIEKYIYDNCGRQQLSGRMIQKELGLSTRTINEILKTHLNTHISQFINIVRIRKAQEIMLNTDLTISEIAYDVGYTDPAYFSRLFKRLTEESPSKWRCERGSEI